MLQDHVGLTNHIIGDDQINDTILFMQALQGVDGSGEILLGVASQETEKNRRINPAGSDQARHGGWIQCLERVGRKEPCLSMEPAC